MILSTLVGGSARAEDRYFLLMFGSQRIPRNPNYAHTFATFARQAAEGGPLESHTISWLPTEFPIRVQALRPQPGRNYGLEETLQIAQRDGARVSLWGPYEIEPELYRRAMKQIRLLESGKVQYKANDTFYRNDTVSNCIHAVSKIEEGRRLVVYSPGWGDTASHFVLERLNPWIIDRTQTHDWVATSLGLDAYPIAYRKAYERPILKPITGVQLFLHDGLPVPTYGPPAQRGRLGIRE
ncbi:hypothetical protein [Limnoglobus roseus]|uniref:hypothetical protein n=1 Tax=Limnoglobus roseus TaxID=2598579 RepID=UPI0011EA989D|nr:hypothetical protein [Limnoglobus roseus]